MARYSVTFLPFNPSLPSDTRLADVRLFKTMSLAAPTRVYMNSFTHNDLPLCADTDPVSEAVFASLNGEN